MHPSEALEDTGAVVIQQDLGTLTVTLQRLDPLWVAKLLRPVMVMVFIGFTAMGLGGIIAALRTLLLGDEVGVGIVQLLCTCFLVAMSVPVLAALLSPVLGYRLLGYRVRLSQTALELPGGLSVRPQTIPFDQLIAARSRHISLLSWRGFLWGHGHYLELVTEDGADVVRIPLKEGYRGPLLDLINAHAAGQRERLASAGHDLSQPAPPPRTLAALRER